MVPRLAKDSAKLVPMISVTSSHLERLIIAVRSEFIKVPQKSPRLGPLFKCSDNHNLWGQNCNYHPVDLVSPKVGTFR